MYGNNQKSTQYKESVHSYNSILKIGSKIKCFKFKSRLCTGCPLLSQQGAYQVKWAIQIKQKYA